MKSFDFSHKYQPSHEMLRNAKSEKSNTKTPAIHFLFFAFCDHFHVFYDKYITSLTGYDKKWDDLRRVGSDNTVCGPTTDIWVQVLWARTKESDNRPEEEESFNFNAIYSVNTITMLIFTFLWPGLMLQQTFFVFVACWYYLNIQDCVLCGAPCSSTIFRPKIGNCFAAAPGWGCDFRLVICFSLPARPTPLMLQSAAFRPFGLAVAITICCMSLQVSSVLASKAKALIPAASGAEADVPVWFPVQSWCKSVVLTWSCHAIHAHTFLLAEYHKHRDVLSSSSLNH